MAVSEQLKRLGKDTLFYGLGSAVQKFIAFFLFPIYTRVLSQAEFGAQDLVYSAVTILSYFMVMGLDSSTARHYYDAETERDRRAVLSTWLFFELLLSIPSCLLLIAFAQPVCGLFFRDRELAPFFQIGVASLPFVLVTRVTLLTLRLTFQAKRFSILSIVGVLVQALAAVWFVVILRLGMMGVFWANMIANLFRAGLGVSMTYQHFRPVLSPTWIRPMLAFGVPLLPASLSLWALDYSNRYFLVRLATLKDIALLGIGTHISRVMSFVIAAFQIAWGPFAFSLFKDQQLAKDTYAKALTYLILLSLIATLSLSTFARELIIFLATPAYEPSAALVPWLCYGSIAWGAAYIVGMGTEFVKKSYYVTLATVAGALVNMVLNFALIPRWSIGGAAVATMLGNMVAFLCRYYAGQRYLYIAYEFRKLFVLIILATGIIAMITWADHRVSVWSPIVLLYKIPLYATFWLGLFACRIVGRDEIGMVRKYLCEVFPRLVGRK